MTATRAFERRIDALGAVVAFTSASFATAGIPAALQPAVDFVLEELFTNMVKYGRGRAPITIEIAAIPGGVEVAISDRGVDRFDVTAAPAVDVSAPIGRREPGGLGLHLIRHMVDFIEYDYRLETRCSRIVFRKTVPPTG